MANIETILTYWFGANPGEAALAKDRADLWWSKNAEADREIRQRFEGAVSLPRRANSTRGSPSRAAGSR